MTTPRQSRPPPPRKYEKPPGRTGGPSKIKTVSGDVEKAKLNTRPDVDLLLLGYMCVTLAELVVRSSTAADARSLEAAARTLAEKLEAAVTRG